MFETVTPEVRSKRVAYETLPISIALHAGAVAGGVLLAVWSVALPTHSPRVMRAYVLVTSLDPPLPAAIAPKPRTARTTARLNAVPQFNPNLLVAPTVVPDKIPTVTQNLAPSIFAPAPADPASIGIPGGIGDGGVGGVPHGTAGGMPVSEDGRVHFGRDAPLPLYVLRRVYPDYPEDQQLAGLQDTVVIRYIIGTDGWIKELNILQHAKQKAFDEATIKALREWRFRPLMQDGRAIEVVHELTVFFELVYR
ncbi:MAG: TonB family protein [Acidobacteriota bacterium]|nr:TonB family protein [Acidobacteriota bacterium]